ncbi:MFS transporter [Burkholderia multivorans]|uniref:MFS transporter n=1 Tax=Burkholderia multivorans TaxID=87883 RepID=UPI0020B26C9D|nr:MFS transporter [Burkholderia multivorans]MCA8176711.1 MFS transporter [Burkholderia multivorans]
MQQSGATSWDTAYEWKIVALLALGFGLVGVDRFMIMPLFPVLMRDLKLDYQDLGHITAALSIVWGASALLTGNLSDRFGHRKVVIPAIFTFSILACASGLAWGVGSLMLIRALMGFAEGAYTPSSITATLDASAPHRHGRNIGIQQAALPLFGLGIAPVLVTQLLRVMPWHGIFALIAVPGLIVGCLTWKIMRDTGVAAAAVHTRTHDAGSHRWYDVLRYRNVPLCFAGMLCWLTRRGSCRDRRTTRVRPMRYASPACQPSPRLFCSDT